MENKLENLIKLVYKKWKNELPKLGQPHPDEETFVCFFEGRLNVEENERIKAHLISCESCAELVAIQARLKSIPTHEVPDEMLKWMKDAVKQENKLSILEIILILKDKFLELVSTTGDVLVGQELVPAPILRSRQIKDFKDEVTILKDFNDIRVEVKIENKQGQSFSLSVLVKEKAAQKVMKDLRVTLIKDDLELESYLSSQGKVIFEHVLLGKYTVQIATLQDKLASILLDVKV